MKFRFGIYSILFLLLILESCGSSKKVTYFQTSEDRKGGVIDLPSFRKESVVRFKPDDLLGITVNIAEAPELALDYNLPLMPVATIDNSSEDFVSPGMGVQSFLIKKDGTIDYPVIGNIKVAGYTQREFEVVLRDSIMKNLTVTPIVTVRLMNFDIIVTGEVGSPGKIRVDKDNINVLEALALAGNMTIYGKRDDIVLFRQNPDGGYKRISLDISREEIIFSPYYFLQQNDVIYVKPNNARAQSADVSPMLNVVLGVSSFMMSFVTFVLLLAKK